MLLDDQGFLTMPWRSYFDQRDAPLKPKKAQETPADGKISITSDSFQVIPLSPAGAVTTDLIAFEGNARNGARIILVCLQNSVTIKDNDVDGGCALGADFVLNAKRAISFIYMEEIKRFIRI